MIELGLQRISQLLAQTPLPWRAIHVAGTNGKGSVCAYVSEMLNAYNRSSYRSRKSCDLIRHGRFTSPHLVDRWDCIQLSNVDKMEAVPSDVFLKAEEAMKQRNGKLSIKASEFELLTATAFKVFAEARLDVGVVEVGLGGRLDATNIIGQPVLDEKNEIIKDVNQANFRPPPLITAITRIGLDHQKFLGSTLREIAGEKAGIMKQGVPLTYYLNQDSKEVNEVFEECAQALHAPVTHVKSLAMTNRTDADVASPGTWREQNGELALVCAWTALAQLGRIPSDSHFAASEDSSDLRDLYTEMQFVIKNHVFPGRQEWISLKSLTGRTEKVLLDGAHNEQGIQLLSEAISDLRGDDSPKPITFVMAISDSQDRKTEQILPPLLRSGDNFISVEFSSVDGMPWVVPKNASVVAEAASKLVPSLKFSKGYSREHLEEALRKGSGLAEKEEGKNLVICGSLYLAGDVHRLLKAS